MIVTNDYMKCVFPNEGITYSHKIIGTDYHATKHIDGFKWVNCSDLFRKDLLRYLAKRILFQERPFIVLAKNG